MQQLSALPAKRCLTACGFLIIDTKVLLVLHKKLGIWLAPGGHVDRDELPHMAAEREFWEETGVKVTAVRTPPLLNGTNSEYLPVPFAVNLHWINKEFYLKREKEETLSLIKTKKWPRGCEQHYVLAYLMKPLGTLETKQNVEETNGIGWFTLEEVQHLETTEDIKQEVELGFKLMDQLH